MSMSKGYAGAAQAYAEWLAADEAFKITLRQAYADGYDWGQAEPERVSAPLSGEWAGESIPELSSTYGYDLWDSDLADSFESGFYDGQAGAKPAHVLNGGK